MQRWYTRIGSMRHRRASERSLPVMPTSPFNEAGEGRLEFLRARIARPGGREQDHIVAGKGERAGAGGLAELALRAVAQHGIAQALSSSEGDPPWIAFAQRITYNHSHQGMVIAPSLGEHALKIHLGLDGPHTKYVD